MGDERELSTTRRKLIGVAATVGAAALARPRLLRAKAPLSLRFLTIPDPDGWHPSLRLKGDWLIFEITDGALSGYGEASHSRDDEQCQARARDLFDRHYRDFTLSLDSLAAKEAELAASSPDFVTATALSGLNQALYELLAKREQVPVWRLFADSTRIEGVPLYATINRALKTRTEEEYFEVVDGLVAQGLETFKCAPFEAVDGPENAVAKAAAGLGVLDRIRHRHPDLGMRVDFHERFVPDDFFRLLPALERLALDWVEEPFAMGPDYTVLESRTDMRVAAGELFWGKRRFEEIAERAWADVIMPDAKHVGGFGPLLVVLEMARGRIEVSPHNPSGPISTAASLHAAALYPDDVHSLEYAYDRAAMRRRYGETIDSGVLYLSEAPGWGIDPTPID
jgi:galactonate dehydratase